MRQTEATRITTTIVLGAALVLGCAAPERSSSSSYESPEEAAAALAELSVELGSLERAIDRATTTAWEATEAPLTLELGREPTGEERDWVRAMLRDTLAGYMTADIWRDAVTGVYGRNFSAAEIDQLIEFYGSALGRKMLSLGDQLADEVDAAMREQLDAHLEELINEVDARLAARFEELGGGS